MDHRALSGLRPERDWRLHAHERRSAYRTGGGPHTCTSHPLTLLRRRPLLLRTHVAQVLPLLQPGAIHCEMMTPRRAQEVGLPLVPHRQVRPCTNRRQAIPVCQMYQMLCLCNCIRCPVCMCRHEYQLLKQTLRSNLRPCIEFLLQGSSALCMDISPSMARSGGSFTECPHFAGSIHKSSGGQEQATDRVGPGPCTRHGRNTAAAVGGESGADTADELREKRRLGRLRLLFKVMQPISERL